MTKIQKLKPCAAARNQVTITVKNISGVRGTVEEGIELLKQEVDYNQDEFEKALEQDKFRPCGNQDLSTFGWTKALGKHGQMLSHFSKKSILLCAKREEKVLPPAVINDLLAEKIAQIENSENRPVKKKEKDELKENLIHSLLPQAFKKSS